MYVDKDSLGNDVNMFADNIPNCDNCALNMGLPVNTPVLAQELLTEVPEKTDAEVYDKDAVSFTINPATLEIGAGDFKILEVVPTPNTANVPNLVWESSDISVAIVSQEGVVYAGSKVGTAVITAIVPEDNSITASLNVSVIDPTQPKEVKVSGITVSPATKAIGKTEKTTLTASVTLADATDKSVTWSSDTTSVATVSASGEVTGVAAGSAKIKATANDGSGVFGEATVTVNPTKVTGITLSDTTKTIEAEAKFTLTATVKPDNADEKGVTWASDKTELATVSETGEVTGVAEGTANITATAKDGSGKTATCAVTVTPKA